MKNRKGYFFKICEERLSGCGFKRYDNALCRVVGDAYQTITLVLYSAYSFEVNVKLGLLCEPFILPSMENTGDLCAMGRCRHAGVRLWKYNSEQEFMECVDEAVNMIKNIVMPIFDASTTPETVRKGIHHIIDLNYQTRLASVEPQIRENSEDFKDYMLYQRNGMTLLMCAICEKDSDYIISKIGKYLDLHGSDFSNVVNKWIENGVAELDKSAALPYDKRSRVTTKDNVLGAMVTYNEFKNIEWCAKNNDYTWTDSVYLPKNRKRNIIELAILHLIE